jgi:hypothetical protein|tara:strand:+ start:6431 stop:6904 length:474 start_codon:yes stop_codon:yes gene_type:complete
MKKKAKHVALPLDKNIVEALMAEMINQIKISLDVVTSQVCDKNKKIKLSRTKNIVACALITLAEINNVLSALEGYSDASLNPKHRAFRQLITAYRKELVALEMWKVKGYHNKKVVKFGKFITNFLTDCHKVLWEDTGKKERRVIVENAVERVAIQSL